MEENQLTPTAPKAIKEKYWQDMLSSWKASGKKQAPFCRERRISRHAFVYWKTRLMPSPRSVASQLVRVPIGRSRCPEDSMIAIVTDRGYRIEVKGAVEVAMLRQVMDILWEEQR
jgi:hypothetical protein